ncbi:hypothetical protein SAMN05660284_01623 [Formivibrio citricus]|uniref:Cell division protein ZapB n=1 Tax=Formivibrio citricus TaxID=83765 RepID=A0A1I4ZG35_9NEIS|nr:hypothetical protein [Formivibrio citricus]SFN49212.1 hypothetical protein SAMN05660284_01623 [Formivibrio citricus]
MEAELARLEEKVNLLARVCTDLRTENQVLRQQLLEEKQEALKLKQKVEGATERVAAILARLPEDA